MFLDGVRLVKVVNVVVLAAAVAFVGVLCLFNMLLTFGVIRRLREHAEVVSRFSGLDVPLAGLARGEPAPAFSATALGGEAVTGPAGLLAVGFFSSGCSICPERVDPFIEYLRSHHIARENTLSVLTGPDAGHAPPPYAERLAEATIVCLEADDGELARAFKIQGFPAFCLLDGAGTVLAAHYDPAMLPAPASAL